MSGRRARRGRSGRGGKSRRSPTSWPRGSGPDFQQDVPLPSKTQLAQHYEVAKGTVRRALALLRDHGLVFTVSGRGTYPSPPA
ncbi:GntR family transcriptional regulator [Nonomuraea wenchangensis]